MIQLFPNEQIMISMGPLSITWYAVMVVSGALISYELIKRDILKMGYNAEELDDLFILVLGAGFLGARLWYVVFYDLGAYLAEPMRIFAITEGGLAIQGGLVAGAWVAYRFLKKRNYSFLRWMDVVAPHVLIAQAIGRWGNFMNREAYGGIVSAKFYTHFPAFIRDKMFIGGEFRAPTFLYESVANIIGWILITFLLKKKKNRKRGDLLYGYLTWYGLTRFFIEGMRTDSLYLFNTGIRMAQLVSLLFVLIGVLGFMGFYQRFIPKQKPVILFDFDGTLADTQSSIIEAAHKTLKEYFPANVYSDETLLKFIGPTLHESFSHHFEEHQIDEAIDRYREHNYELHNLVTAMPHALEVLDQLQEQGFRMGIVSNKQRKVVDHGLEILNMTQYFEVVYGYDDFEFVKPHPAGINKAIETMGASRDALIYVGDTASDIEAGRRAGAFTIGFLFDTMRYDALKMSNPNRLIDDLSDILEIIKEAHEWTHNLT